jgi:hypothetical protein
MPSETERITYEVWERHEFDKLANLPGRAHSQTSEGQRRAATDQHFTNDAYIKLENPARNSFR